MSKNDNGKDNKPFQKYYKDKPQSRGKERQHFKATDDSRRSGGGHRKSGTGRPEKKNFENGLPTQTNKRSHPASSRPEPRSDKKPDKASGSSRSRFRKFEEEDLSFGARKAPAKPPASPELPEVTFSKSINDKWHTEPVKPVYNAPHHAGKSSRARREADGETRQSRRFKKHFDHENPSEKVFDSQGRRPTTADNSGHYYDEKALAGQMPLNKFIAHCDICSRREAVVLIKEGKVKVNGTLVTEPGFKVTTDDQVTLSGKKLAVQKNLIYILLNKPKGYITTTDDPKGRRTVMDIFSESIEERIFPVGRLDRNTTGLLLLTNDGALAQELAHPKFAIRKVYQVTLDKDLSKQDFEKIQTGVVLEDGPAPVDQLAFLDTAREVGLEIHSGKNRIVRRIFESLGYQVEKLDRVMYAGLTKKNITRGKWRFLTKQEVINLRHFR